jgi:hypothetical protein
MLIAPDNEQTLHNELREISPDLQRYGVHDGGRQFNNWLEAAQGYLTHSLNAVLCKLSMERSEADRVS